MSPVIKIVTTFQRIDLVSKEAFEVVKMTLETGALGHPLTAPPVRELPIDR